MTAASEILRLASAQLQDVDHVRWSLPELADWLDEARKAVVLAKPSAKCRARILKLAEGTLQRVETAAGLPTPLAIIDFTRNLKTDAEPRQGLRSIRVVSRGLLDASDPDWHSGRPTTIVRQVTFDEENPLEFYCYPPNDGKGVVEGVVSEVPEPLAATGGDPNALAAWSQDVGLAPVYDPPLLSYVLHRAELKDDVAANAGRAQIHYQAFATALGIRIQTERSASPNRQRTGQ